MDSRDSRESLIALRDRVAGLKGGSDHLDEEVFIALFPGVESTTYNGDARWRPYSSSVEAAISLIGQVLPGWNWLYGRGRLRPAEPLYGAQILDGTKVVATAEHDLGPLALLLALLNALTSGGQTHG